MLKMMYSIYDKKTEVFHAPVCCHNVSDALRYFKSMLMFDKQSNVAMFPDDFDIYLVGSFNQTDGKVVAGGQPSFISTFVSLNEQKAE